MEQKGVKELVRKSNCAGELPLMLALRSGNSQACTVLLEVMKDVKLEFKDEDENSVLHLYACGGGDETVFEALMRHPEVKQLLNARNKHKQTPLMLALVHGSSTAVVKILEQGEVEVDGEDDDGNSVLHCFALGAAVERAKEIWEILTGGSLKEQLVSKYINKANNEGDMPLMIALASGQSEEACEVLLQASDGSAMRTWKNEAGDTVLHCYACASVGEEMIGEAGRVRVWEELMKREGVKEWMNSRNKQGRSPLMQALLTAADESVLRILSTLGDTVQRHLALKDNDGYTALHLARERGERVWKELLRQGRWPINDFLNLKRNTGATVLMDLALKDNWRVVELLFSSYSFPAGTAAKISLHNYDLNRCNVFHYAADSQSTIPKYASTYVLEALLQRSHQDGLEEGLHEADSEGFTPHLTAALGGNLHHCAMLEHRKPSILTAIDQAAFGDNGVVTFLLGQLDSPEARKAAVVNTSNAKNKFKGSLFHVAAANGNTILCERLIAEFGESLLTIRDVDGEIPIFWAVQNNLLETTRALVEASTIDDKHIHHQNKGGETVLHLACRLGYFALLKQLLTKWINEDSRATLLAKITTRGETALHIACRQGHLNIVCLLLEHSPMLLRTCDQWGKPPLHVAAAFCNADIVKHLLTVPEQELDLLEARDADGRTALHWAVTPMHPAPDENAALAAATTLLEYAESKKFKALLLWASAGPIIGTAFQSSRLSKVNQFLQQEMNTTQRAMEDAKEDLLNHAIERQNYNMAKELINRGANIATVTDVAKREKLEQTLVLRASDQPSPTDSLGRLKLAKGIAALLLNPFTKTPITIGVYGTWGMGKSSFMLQVELILLWSVTQQMLSHRNHEMENFPGVLKTELTKQGLKLKHDIVNMIKAASSKGKERFDTSMETHLWWPQLWWKLQQLICQFRGTTHSKEEIELSKLCGEYHHEWLPLLKGLASADKTRLVKISAFASNHTLEHNKRPTEVPALITVRFNAWEYQSQQEASAGLVVKITQEMESCMNTAQWIRLCWRYAWRKRSDLIFVNVMLPLFLSMALGGLIAWIAWNLLSLSNNSDLQSFRYGSVPISAIVITWVVLRNIINIVRPFSQQLLECTYLNNEHHKKLGYEQEVIADINFMKSELSDKPGFATMWNFLGRLYSIFVENRDYIPGTKIAKLPLFKQNLRVIVFIDDLDRCKEGNYVAQMVSAILLILSACDINVVLGIDKDMIHRAIKNEFNFDNELLAEQFLQKIVQLPVDLAQPSFTEMKSFLDDQLDIRQEYKTGRVNNGTDQTCNTVPPRSNEAPLTPKIQPGLGNNSSDQAGGKLASPDPKSHITTTPGRSERRTIDYPVLAASYNDSEGETLKVLLGLGIDEYKQPRQWKRFLNYHRLAWNVISQSQSEDVKSLDGWQCQLIVWVFVCWQWRNEMNEIIEHWTDIVTPTVQKKKSIEGTLRGHETCCAMEVKTSNDEGPSLGTIVVHRMSQKWPTELQQADEKVDNKTDTNKDTWIRLKDTLGKYDVSMKAIQAFQGFRFHCKIGFLHWPLPSKGIKTPRAHNIFET